MGNLFATDLETDAEGFIAIRDTLQSVSRENVFAVGDCASSIDNPISESRSIRSKTGPYFVSQRSIFSFGEEVKGL